MKLSERSEWTAALRSDQYPQGKSALCDVGGNYCCLGVKASLDGVLRDGDDPSYGKRTAQNVPGGYFYYYGQQRELEAQCPTDAVPEDMRTVGRLPRSVTIYAVLAWMNDNDWSFDQIADWIDANVPVDD